SPIEIVLGPSLAIAGKKIEIGRRLRVRDRVIVIGIPVRQVVRHKIEKHAHAARVRGSNQLMQIVFRSQLPPQAKIIGYSIAEVAWRTFHDGCEPESCYPKLGKPIEMRGDIGEAAWTEQPGNDAIDDRAIDPGGMVMIGIDLVQRAVPRAEQDDALIGTSATI